MKHSIKKQLALNFIFILSVIILILSIAYLILFRTFVENYVLLNIFILVVAFFMFVVGFVLIIIFTDRISKPIVRLTEISSKMARLDFDAKYESKGYNEIDVLGENINEMSEKLEQTISELKSTNSELYEILREKTEMKKCARNFLQIFLMN